MKNLIWIILLLCSLAFAQGGVVGPNGVIGPKGVVFGGGASAAVPTVSLIVSSSGCTASTCATTASASIGDLVGICQVNEGGSMGAPGDSGGVNTYALISGGTWTNGSIQVLCYWDKLTGAITGGVTTINWGTGAINGYVAFKVTGLATGSIDVATASTQGFGTAFASGATSNTTGATDACLGVTGTGQTISVAGTGFSILTAGITVVDLRGMGLENGNFASGNAVNAQATISSASSGVMGAMCFK